LVVLFTITSRDAVIVSITLLTLLSALAVQAHAQGYAVQRATMTVYRDGWVHVNVEVIVDPTEPSTTFQLLSSSVNNVLVIDEEGEPLAYDVSGTNITVYTLGASKVVLEYDTIALTSMSAGVWTTSFTTPHPLTLILPENATIIYFNAPPSSIKSEGARLALELSPGSWEISYVLEAPTISPPPQGGTRPPQQAPLFPANALVLAVGVIVVAITLSLFLLKRRGGVARAIGLEALDEDEVKVIEVLRSRGGRALEVEIREALGLPKTTAWRLVRRLEKKGLVVVRKVGNQNVVELRVSS
jgi:uncharacterized membrane protein